MDKKLVDKVGKMTIDEQTGDVLEYQLKVCNCKLVLVCVPVEKQSSSAEHGAAAAAAPGSEVMDMNEANAQALLRAASVPSGSRNMDADEATTRAMLRAASGPVERDDGETEKKGFGFGIGYSDEDLLATYEEVLKYSNEEAAKAYLSIARDVKNCRGTYFAKKGK